MLRGGGGRRLWYTFAAKQPDTQPISYLLLVTMTRHIPGERTVNKNTTYSTVAYPISGSMTDRAFHVRALVQEYCSLIMSHTSRWLGRGVLKYFSVRLKEKKNLPAISSTFLFLSKAASGASACKSIQHVLFAEAFSSGRRASFLALEAPESPLSGRVPRNRKHS